jgi:hypothetical protein
VQRPFGHNSLLRKRDPEGISLLVSAFYAANLNGSRTPFVVLHPIVTGEYHGTPGV